MKIGRTLVLAAVTIAVRDAAALSFGPANCVSVSRSSAGSCVLKTSCAGHDLTNFDISFDCLAQSGRQTHSMGIGAFDSEEEYDTDLKCQQCLPPASATAAKPLSKRAAAVSAKGVSLAAVSVSRAVKLQDEPEKKKKKEEEVETPKAEWYGPESCVGIWKDDKSGACVMQTDCDADTQLDVYEFGLICSDENDEMTRHIFGMGSFGHKETFNTMIKCDKCLALDEYMDGNKAIGRLGKMVKGMKDDLKGVSGQVGKLNQEVFPKAAGPAGAPAGAAPAAASAPAAAQPVKFLASPPQKQAPPTPPAATQPPAPPTTPVMQYEVPAAAVMQQHLLPQPQDLGKDVVAASAQEVTHRKKKASEAKEPESMTEILAAAVNGAAARGVSLSGTADTVLKAAAAKSHEPLQAVQTQQEVVVEHQKAPAHEAQKAQEEQIEVVVDKQDEAQSDEEDHSNGAGTDDDDDDGFR